MTSSAETLDKTIIYWELYHEKAGKFKEYIHIVFTSFIVQKTDT